MMSGLVLSVIAGDSCFPEGFLQSVETGRADQRQEEEDQADKRQRHEIFEGAFADHVGKAHHFQR